MSTIFVWHTVRMLNSLQSRAFSLVNIFVDTLQLVSVF